MMLPGNGSRTTTPFTSRAVRGSKIWMPFASSSEKSPLRILIVGTELVNDSMVSSCSFSYENMKKVLLRKIGPPIPPLYRL